MLLLRTCRIKLKPLRVFSSSVAAITTHICSRNYKMKLKPRTMLVDDDDDENYQKPCKKYHEILVNIHPHLQVQLLQLQLEFVTAIRIQMKLKPRTMFA